jgi:hypothetical protein
MTTSVKALPLDNENAGSIRAGSSPLRHRHVARRTLGPGRVARLAARARPGSLDRQLIAGLDAADSPQLAARAARLVTPRTRALLAEGLERLLGAAQGPQRRWCAVGQRAPLLANAQEIRELTLLLRGETPLRARGIAILSELLSDGTGPAYQGGREDLARRLAEARSAICG